MDEENKKNGNVIGLVHSQERTRRFHLNIFFQDGSMEAVKGDYFGVSMENADCFMVGRTSGEDVIPIGFYYLPLTKKIEVKEIEADDT